jgi:hypothetical protein
MTLRPENRSRRQQIKEITAMTIEGAAVPVNSQGDAVPLTAVTFEIIPLSEELLAKVRRDRTDVSGNPVVELEAAGGEPLRCCLRNARSGEAILLFGHEPLLPASPYREIGAVFAHTRPCAGPMDAGGYPSEWRDRPQVLRAYDQRGWICDAQTHDGTDPALAITTMLENEAVAEIHSRNIAYGCYMFLIRRI